MATGPEAKAPASDESTMDDILRSIRSILDDGSESDDRADFSLPEGARPANDTGVAATAELPPGPPLAFLRRSNASMPDEGHGGGSNAVPSSDRLSLEERLMKHREKAEAEKIALRRLSARAAAKERVAERDPFDSAEMPEADAREMIDEFETAFAASDDLFEPVSLPDLEAEQTSYAPQQPLDPSQAPVVSISPDDVARALLAERGGEVNEALAGMLRTMVRDWLDDNLSTVVERVVREEIERVSRGRR